MNTKIEIRDKNLLNRIRNLINSNSYVECGICESIKADAKELARVLKILLDKYYENDEGGGGNEEDILNEIIEGEPELDSIEDWEKWDKENENRKCGFLESRGYETARYIKYKEVVLFLDEECECQKVWA